MIVSKSPTAGEFESHEHFNFFAGDQAHDTKPAATSTTRAAMSINSILNPTPLSGLDQPELAVSSPLNPDSGSTVILALCPSPAPPDATDKKVEHSDISHPNRQPAANTVLSSTSVKSRKRPSSVDLDTDEERFG